VIKFIAGIFDRLCLAFSGEAIHSSDFVAAVIAVKMHTGLIDIERL
jgi:hypothetical protein